MDSEIVKVAIQEGPTNVLNIVITILTAITAVGALVAAAAAWRITGITNKAREQQLMTANKARELQLISDLLDYRYEKKMHQSMLALKKWYVDHKDWYDKHMDDEQAVDEEFKSIRETTDKGRELDKHRKFFFTYFRKIKDLIEAELIEEEKIQLLVNSSDLSMLLYIAAPLERAIKPTLFEKPPIKPISKEKPDIFDYFKEFYWKYFGQKKGY